MRILRVVGSRTLPCGCFAGIYETYGGQCVEFIDELARNCEVAEHRHGLISGGKAGCKPGWSSARRPRSSASGGTLGALLERAREIFRIRRHRTPA